MSLPISLPPPVSLLSSYLCFLCFMFLAFLLSSLIFILRLLSSSSVASQLFFPSSPSRRLPHSSSSSSLTVLHHFHSKHPPSFPFYSSLSHDLNSAHCVSWFPLLSSSSLLSFCFPFILPFLTTCALCFLLPVLCHSLSSLPPQLCVLPHLYPSPLPLLSPHFCLISFPPLRHPSSEYI